MHFCVPYDGMCLVHGFQEEVQGLAEDVQQNNGPTVVTKINNVFFEGGPLDSKSFAAITSIKAPRIYDDGGQTIMRKENTWSGYLGYLEAIPLIGTVIAIVNALAHLLFMSLAHNALVEAVGEKNDYKIFDAAIDYTIHYNHMIGSLLAIIPLVKPITRLVQYILFLPNNLVRPSQRAL